MGTIRQGLLPEFEQEWANTRKLIAAAPEAKGAWKPHAKSMSLGDLAMHLASILTWVPATLKATELDLAPPRQPEKMPPKFVSMADTLQTFDENLAVARACLAGASDADWMVPWTLKKSDVPLFTLPRVACVRSFVMNHMIHHRGQLSVYLRLCDVPLPSMYGPTADVRS